MAVLGWPKTRQWELGRRKVERGNGVGPREREESERGKGLGEEKVNGREGKGGRMSVKYA